MDEITVTKCKSVSFPGNVSAALPIPKREQYDEKQLGFIRIYSYTSICQNYPDLQIAGDHVGNMYYSGCFVEHICDDAFSGPLCFQYIPLVILPSLNPRQTTYLKAFEWG